MCQWGSKIYLFYIATFVYLTFNCISLSEGYFVSERYCGLNSETKYASENEMV